MLNPSPERERGREGGRGGKREGEGERREGERGFRNVHTHADMHTRKLMRAHYVHVHILCTYYYVLYTHPERDQCYNESRQSVPDASSGPGQSIHGCRERG